MDPARASLSRRPFTGWCVRVCVSFASVSVCLYLSAFLVLLTGCCCAWSATFSVVQAAAKRAPAGGREDEKNVQHSRQEVSVQGHAFACCRHTSRHTRTHTHTHTYTYTHTYIHTHTYKHMRTSSTFSSLMCLFKGSGASKSAHSHVVATGVNSSTLQSQSRQSVCYPHSSLLGTAHTATHTATHRHTETQTHTDTQTHTHAHTHTHTLSLSLSLAVAVSGVAGGCCRVCAICAGLHLHGAHGGCHQVH